MSSSSPWDDIALPGADFNVRQVPLETAVPCFWGRDRAGACLFIVELKGDHTDQFRKNSVPVHGVNVDLRWDLPGQQILVLTLEQQVDRDLFESLCLTLAAALERATDPASSLAVALAHIRRWKAFLSGRSRHLTAQEVRGLFAELSFLLELMERQSPSTTAVDAWLGPEKSHQDFIYENSAVEIKSLSGIERSSVRISSEDQLESLNDALFLRIYRLSAPSDSASALSLNDIVATVETQLKDADGIEAFEQKLVAHGYAPLPEYDSPKFVISDVHTYHVVDGFPRLMRSKLPRGIERLAYDIRLETIAPYECDNTEVFGEDR